MNDTGFDQPKPQPLPRVPADLPQSEASIPIPEPLSGAETAELVSQMYEIVGPRVGPLLVEANIVLTLAGARGQTEFFISNPQKEDWTKIDEINKWLATKGISFDAQEDAFKSPSDGKETLMVSIDNLRGYERMSKKTKIPGIRPYEASSCWEGLDKWRFSTFYSLEKAQTEGKISYPADDIPHIFAGVAKGYPDQAIYDAMDWGLQDRQSPTVDTDIQFVSLYGGAEPNFMYHPDHSGDLAIKETISMWGKVIR